MDLQGPKLRVGKLPAARYSYRPAKRFGWTWTPNPVMRAGVQLPIPENLRRHPNRHGAALTTAGCACSPELRRRLRRHPGADRR